MADQVVCPYCNKRARLVTGKELYPRRADLSHVKAYICQPCDARVGCHDGTNNPKGTLANKELRAARIKAHAAFDPLWKQSKNPKVIARKNAYRWMMDELGLTPAQAHIGMMDIETCDKLIEAIEQRRYKSWKKKPFKRNRDNEPPLPSNTAGGHDTTDSPD